MKKTNFKKIIIGLFVATTMLFSTTACSSSSKAMKAIEGKDGLYAILETEKGEVALELFYDKTPMTVANFVGLAEGTLDVCDGKPFYNGLTFHRVIEKFMAQGGDPLGNGTGGPGYQFPDEIVPGLEFNKEGKLAMANAGPGTNGSQFFITTIHTEWLNGKHTIFGEVVEGQDVVDAIEQGDHIKSLKIIRNGKDAEKFKVDQTFFEDLIAKDAVKKEEANKKLLKDATNGMEKTDKGIYYQVVEEGSGEICGERRFVAVEYMGYLLDGTIFDASSGMIEGGHDPISFVTQAGQMIPGFDLSVQEMKLGETRKVILPPAMGYGEYGYPGVIPPNSFIGFTIKLTQFK